MSTAIFFNVPAHGHINPTLPLVKELTRRGERIIYYATASFATKIEAAGAEFRATPGIREDDPVFQANPVQLGAAIMSLTEQILPQLQRIIQQEQPDYIIHDGMCVWGWYVAQLWGRPSVCSTATLVLDEPTLREVGSFSEMMAELIRSLPALWRIQMTTRRLQSAYPAPPRRLSDIFVNRADWNLVYTSRRFQPGSDRYGADYCFAGPSLPEKLYATADFPWQRLNGRSVIYAALGTIFNNRPDFFRACSAAFGDTEHLLVLAIGDKFDVSLLGPLPDNVIVRPFVPQTEVLARANLFISHGGMNSVTGALLHGVPLLVYPQIGEQGFNGRRVAVLGAGELLRDRDLAPARLRRLATQLMENGRYRAAAQRIGDSFRAAGGPTYAADQLLQFVNRQSSIVNRQSLIVNRQS